MNICFLSKMYPPISGGSSTYAYEITNSLAERGHSIDVFTQVDPGDTRRKPLNENITVYNITKSRKYLMVFETLYYSSKLRKKIDFNKYDIIHGTLMPASPVALDVKNIKTPLVVTSHGTSIGEVRSHNIEIPTDALKKFFFHPINVAMDAGTAYRSDAIIAISSISYNELKKYYPVSSEKLKLIPHGVDINRFDPSVGDHPSVSNDKFTLLYVGRLVSRKHIDLALESIANCKCDDIELLIAGKGRHYERLKSKVEKMQLDDVTKFLGFVSESRLPSLYSSADLFLFLSRYEGFGLTFLEAMASGTPVLGVPVGGFPDVVDHEINGYIVDRNPKSIATTIDKIVSNKDDYKKVREGAIHSSKTHSWGHTARRTEKLYNRLL